MAFTACWRIACNVARPSFGLPDVHFDFMHVLPDEHDKIYQLFAPPEFDSSSKPSQNAHLTSSTSPFTPSFFMALIF